MINLRKFTSESLAFVLVAAASLATPACDHGNGGNGGSGGTGGGGGGGSGGGGNGGGGGGGGGGGNPPPTECTGDESDAPAMALDFANNLLPSPSAPGNLTAANAPQIVVFGWDDVENDAGIAFVNTLLGGIKNPDNSKGGATL